MKDNNVIENNSQFLIWHDNVHGVNVNVILHDDNIWLTADYQFCVNPGYNKDRQGPVNIFSVRLHARI